jgi:hypothetical protein
MSDVSILELLEDLAGDVVFGKITEELCFELFVGLEVLHNQSNSIILMYFLYFRIPFMIVAKNGGNNKHNKPLEIIFGKIVPIKLWQQTFNFHTYKISPSYFFKIESIDHFNRY